MKKKILSIAAVAAIAVVAAWSFNESSKDVVLSDVALSNVEALAQSESGKNDKSLAQKANGDYCCAKNPGNNCTSSPDC